MVHLSYSSRARAAKSGPRSRRAAARVRAVPRGPPSPLIRWPAQPRRPERAANPPVMPTPGSSARGQAPAGIYDFLCCNEDKSRIPAGACPRALDPGARHHGGSTDESIVRVPGMIPRLNRVGHSRIGSIAAVAGKATLPPQWVDSGLSTVAARTVSPQAWHQPIPDLLRVVVVARELAPQHTLLTDYPRTNNHNEYRCGQKPPPRAEEQWRADKQH